MTTDRDFWFFPPSASQKGVIWGGSAGNATLTQTDKLSVRQTSLQRLPFLAGGYSDQPICYPLPFGTTPHPWLLSLFSLVRHTQEVGRGGEGG